MKKVWMSVASCLFVFAAIAQDKGYDKKDKGKYGDKDKQDSSKTWCFSTKDDGKRVVKYGEKEVTEDVKLSNGTTIKSDGTVIMKDGTKKTLKENECVDMNGKVVGPEMQKPYKKDDEKDYDDIPK